MRALTKTEPGQADRLWWRRLGVGEVRSTQVPALTYRLLRAMKRQVPGARCRVATGRQAGGR